MTEGRREGISGEDLDQSFEMVCNPNFLRNQVYARPVAGPRVERAAARARGCGSGRLDSAAGGGVSALPARIARAGLAPAPAARAPRTCRPETQSASAPALPGWAERLQAGVPGLALGIRSGERRAAASGLGALRAQGGGLRSSRSAGRDLRGSRRRGGDGRRFGLGWKRERGLRTLYCGLLAASRPGLMTHDLVSIRGLVRATQQSGRFPGGEIRGLWLT
ncbi:uncharacterized protein LOC129538678 [Moschus berezovskii]|uniref:uncharacterized protein LOC129538678 n=1 Tax=Moschus berezovskii TaxID=68408 RepID=UPI002444D107|nr:uncharacterized protein LOC129538678 [Moschus berezovskii]